MIIIYIRYEQTNSNNLFSVFPKFDLVKIAQINTSVQKRVSSSEHLRKAFLNRYLMMFEEYIKRRALLGPDMEET